MQLLGWKGGWGSLVLTVKCLKLKILLSISTQIWGILGASQTWRQLSFLLFISKAFHTREEISTYSHHIFRGKHFPKNVTTDFLKLHFTKTTLICFQDR